MFQLLTTDKTGSWAKEQIPEGDGWEGDEDGSRKLNKQIALWSLNSQGGSAGDADMIN